MRLRGAIIAVAVVLVSASAVVSCTEPELSPRRAAAPPRVSPSAEPPADPGAPRGAGGAPAPRPVKLYAAVKPVALTAESSFVALGSAQVSAEARRYPPATQEAPPAPLALTASDGTGLALTALRVRAVLEGPLALTELHLVFRNPEPRVIEGRFSITLPSGAAISRFAMKLPQGWQEAEVVERRAAQEAYEDFLHRRQDPALLEKKAGNEFSARIFPIAASGEKEIKITYSQELAAAGGVYRLPLQGLPKLPELEVTLLYGERERAGVCIAEPLSASGTTRGERSVTVRERGFRPPRDFVAQTRGCAVGQGAGGRPRGLRHDNLTLLPLRPTLTTTAAPVTSLLVLFDTSASRAAGFGDQVVLLGRLLAQLDGQARLQVACFDQLVTPIYEGPASGFGDAARRQILERRALGASNLYAALAWAAGRKGYKRLLLVGDGVATAGVTEGDGLVGAVRALRGSVERLDALLLGGIRDEELVRRLVRGNLPQDGLVLDGEQPLAELARRLGQSTVSGVEVDVKGARWIWPSRLDGVQPGDEVLIYADLPAAALAVGRPATVTLSGPLRQAQEVALEPAARPLLERSWVAARIAKLVDERDRAAERNPARREAVRQEIIALSTKHRVLSDYTALLVLETEADYARFKIDRRALAEILAVGEKGVELLSRQGINVPAENPPPPTDDVADATDRLKRKVAGATKADEKVERAAGPGAAARVARSQGALRLLGAKGGSLGNVLGGKSGGGRGGSGDVDRSLRGGVSRGGDGEATGVEGVGRGGGGEAAGVAGLGLRREALAKKAAPRSKVARADPEPRRPAAPGPRGRDTRVVRGDLDDLVDGAIGGRRARHRRVADSESLVDADDPAPRSTPALTGRMAKVAALLKAGQRDQAVTEGLRWRAADAGDVLALVALGDALRARGQPALAARAYGSLIDLFPSRADMRRYAGMLLEALGPAGQALAADSYAEAALQRPDHPNSHRLLGYALLRLGEQRAAFAALEAGLKRDYPEGRFAGATRVLREDLALAAAAWGARDPQAGAEIERRLRAAGAEPEREPSLRFVLSWETDANDVDFHIHDGQRGHAFYRAMTLPSGGSLYADVTTGYGPECFTIRGKPRAFPYRLRIHYYSRGPMGYGMGKLEIVQHDGRGGLKFEQRPYVVMTDQAYVDLGTIAKPL